MIATFNCTEKGNFLHIEIGGKVAIVDPYQGTVNRGAGTAWPGRNDRRVVAVVGRLTRDGGAFQFERAVYEDGATADFNNYPREIDGWLP